jgi:hypothetical protein
MRKAIAKELKKRFMFNMRGFEQGFVKHSDSKLPSSYYVVSAKRNATTIFIAMLPSPLFDTFTIEAAWSKSGELPSMLDTSESVSVLSSGDLGSLDVRDSCRFRASRIWGQDDYWWQLDSQDSPEARQARDHHFMRTGELLAAPSVEEAILGIDRQLNDAFSRLREYVLPFLDHVASKLK